MLELFEKAVYIGFVSIAIIMGLGASFILACLFLFTFLGIHK